MSETDTTPFKDALTGRVKEALGFWGLGAQTPQLLKYRENAVFRVILANGEQAALRLHRPGYHDETALASELAWMAALQRAGLRVPSPVATLDGRHIVELPATTDFDVQHVDIVSWMAGTPLGQSRIPFEYSRSHLDMIFRSLGEIMARMHAASDNWNPPSCFNRPSWDSAGLLGKRPLWGRFWDCTGLSTDQKQRLGDLRLDLEKRVEALSERGMDYGLIHADLVRENILVDGENIELIDFDDGGYGWRMFDIATALFKNREEPDYALIKQALIEGYQTIRPLNDSMLETLPLFMVLRSVTYIGWMSERPETPGTMDRLQHYVADAFALADALQAGKND